MSATCFKSASLVRSSRYAFVTSSSCLRITSIALTMSAAAEMSSRSRSCSFTERSRSATDVATLGSRRISIGCVADWPSTVSFTVYFPGTTIGPTCAGSRPQCVTGRVSFPRNLGSSQMCGFSAGVVLMAMRRGGS